MVRVRERGREGKQREKCDKGKEEKRLNKLLERMYEIVQF